MATTIGSANLREYFNSEAYVKRPHKGFVTTLGQEMPTLMYGPTNYFDLSEDTVGKFVGEGEAKNGNDISTPLRQVRTEKIVYDQRISQEAYNQLQETGGLNAFLQSLTNKWLGNDLERDLDNLAMYGKTLSTGSHTLDDYITKSGSANVVAATSDSAADIDKALTGVIADAYDSIALNGPTAAKLATVMNGNIQKYPSLGAFGVGATTIGGIRAAISRAIGSQGTAGEVIVAGDFNTIRWGIVNEAAIKLLEAGNPDGKGDLGNTNQFLIRLELFIAVGLANHDALTVITAKATDPEARTASVKATSTKATSAKSTDDAEATETQESAK